jgi:dihydropteroate synthase-like protein
MPRDHIHFVTGRLAEFALRKVLVDLAPQAMFDYSISVLGITVAALMTPDWIARRLKVPAETTRVLVSGYCHGDLAPIAAVCGKPVERGPKDLRDLPLFFGQKAHTAEYGQYDIEILAEINHAPRLSRAAILEQAQALTADGANLIDLGCDPGDAWTGVGDAVRALRDAGHRVSIDSLNPAEIAPAVRAGAELVLSVNSSNRQAAADWGCEVVAVPDVPDTLAELDATIEYLATAGVPLRIDPILEPIGFGFARSLQRYLTVRDRYPEAEMLMGIGNLTELTDVDSAGVNVLLLGFCQELGIRSILTTQVINWARSCVRECDLARRLVHYAVRQRTLPKHLDPRLVMLRDPRLLEFGDECLERLCAEIKDHNYRLFAEGGELHLLAAGLHLRGCDPFDLFDQLQASGAKNLDASHAFYLGYELAKATTALTLGKHYRQDQALDWGFLTRPEAGHRSTAKHEHPPNDGPEGSI